MPAGFTDVAMVSLFATMQHLLQLHNGKQVDQLRNGLHRNGC
jgi:hypothetical protein